MERLQLRLTFPGRQRTQRALDEAGGVVAQTLVLGQQKMSLKDGLRSIVGRAVLVHSREDDGTQPYGNAGPPEAYGVIGIASTADGATNEATAPSIPEVDKVICTFEVRYCIATGYRRRAK